MQFVPWAAALIASTIAGACVCGAVIARRRLILPFVAAVGLALAAAAVAIAALWTASQRVDSLIAAVALSIAACIGGYALGAAVLSAITVRRPRAAAIDAAATRPGTHVVLLADAEPEQYDPAAVTAGLRRYDDGDVDLPPEIARPLIYASERARYHRTGGSQARGVVHAIAASLEARLSADGVADHVSVAFCDRDPSLQEAVAEIVAGGGRRIVVAPLTAAWSRAFTEASEDVLASGLASLGVSLEFADPLWASPHLSAMIAQRVVSCLGGDRSTDGAVLLSEGDPWEHAKSEAAYREQLTFLIQRVRAELLHAGVAAGRIRRAWLWLEEPDIAEAVRHLAAVGARSVVVVPVTFPTETIATLVDLRYDAERASSDTGASVNVIAPWGDDPAVVEALADATTAAAERLERA